MTLSEFILANLEPLLVEWENFARTILPATQAMTTERLRDHAKEMLIGIANDMLLSQSDGQQQDKSEGRRDRSDLSEDSPAETHTVHRLAEGFTLLEVVAEYRALRASVIRLWTSEVRQTDRTSLDQLTRFNEAIDEGLCESIARYTTRIERARDLLLGALGHDLRNPLGAILQSANYPLSSESLGTTHTKAAARILNSGTRMKGMIADLLDFASTRLGDELPVAATQMDLGEACHAAVEEIAAFHPDRVIELTTQGSLGGCWDSARIAQLLSNLLGNAVRHGRPGAPVLVSASGADLAVRIEVHNEGVPIPEGRRRNLFEPLTRGAVATADSSAPLNRSVGLGLYIACQITKAHGGTLQLASSNETGTTFAVNLPRHSEGSDHLNRERSAHRVPSWRGTGAR